MFPMIIWLDKKYHFSLTSLGLLLIFTVFHTVGAHYTYAKMPYFESVTKFFGFERNHFDRVVHFLYGLLLFKPILEIIVTYLSKRRISLIFTFCMVVTIATLYEILEWLASVLFHPDLGMAFLGTQGDIWDAQQDILVAIIGALINVAIFFPSYKNNLK
jgi:putative membrane protein